jgi:hypothetical protein
MDQLTTVLGILGSYFAIVFVLAVSVETIIEPFTWLKPLQKKVSPEDVLSDIKGWLPPIADMGTRAAAIANLSEEYHINPADIQARLNLINPIADETGKGLGLQRKIDETEKKIAIYMAVLRAKFALDERKRITLLRIISALFGITLAIFLKIDSFDILGSLLPPNVRDILTSPGGQMGGMVITGLASSAGSSFWHDQLGRIRAIKEAARSV